MSSMIVRPPDDEHAYEQIEAAVMETSRGRWFLAEYARRNRHSDTMAVLEAIESLQKNVTHRGALPAPDGLLSDIVEMARAIARTEREIRQIRPDGAAESQFVSASDELDAVVATTEKATSSILSAAEKVQEYAWTMREVSGNEDDCDQLDACATEIYTACGFQDLTSQRIRKVVETLRFLDQRLKSMLETLGLAEDFVADEAMIAENDVAPAAQTTSDIWMSDVSQAEIDDTFDFFEPAAVEVMEPTMIGADLMDLGSQENRTAAPIDVFDHAPQATAADTAALSVLPETPYDGLSTEEKLRAFR